MKSSLKLNEVIILMVGCLFMAVSINMFLNPHNIAPGGLTGVSIIINTLTGLPIWLINVLFDIPLFLFAFRILGRKDATKTLLGILFLTLSLKLTENLGNIQITNDVLLSSISGGIVLGIALGLIFRINGSTGGTDLIGLLANKAFPSLSVPTLMGSSISGGIVLGIALGLIFRINGSTGGTDLIGLLANKAFPSLSVPTLMGCA